MWLNKSIIQQCSLLLVFSGCCWTQALMTTEPLCLTPEPVHVKQIFGINVHSINVHPLVPVIRKKMCATEKPHVHVVLGDAHFNLLNATISATACQELYRKTICNNTKQTPTNNCKHANQIMFAAVQGIETFRSDADCTDGAAVYVMPLLWCEWVHDISQDVCHGNTNDMVLRPCEEDAGVATRIRNACIFTDWFCLYFISNMRIIAPVTGTVFFCLVFSCICCSTNSYRYR